MDDQIPSSSKLNQNTLAHTRKLDFFYQDTIFRLKEQCVPSYMELINAPINLIKTGHYHQNLSKFQTQRSIPEFFSKNTEFQVPKPINKFENMPIWVTIFQYFDDILIFTSKHNNDKVRPGRKIEHTEYRTEHENNLIMFFTLNDFNEKGCCTRGYLYPDCIKKIARRKCRLNG